MGLHSRSNGTLWKVLCFRSTGFHQNTERQWNQSKMTVNFFKTFFIWRHMGNTKKTYKIYSVAWLDVFKLCHLHSAQVMKGFFILFSQEGRYCGVKKTHWEQTCYLCVFNIFIMLHVLCQITHPVDGWQMWWPRSWEFWRSGLTSSERTAGGVCCISVLLWGSPHWPARSTFRKKNWFRDTQKRTSVIVHE